LQTLATSGEAQSRIEVGQALGVTKRVYGTSRIGATTGTMLDEWNTAAPTRRSNDRAGAHPRAKVVLAGRLTSQ